LGLASTGTNGALSSTDWNTFNGKVSFPGFGTSHTTAAYGDHLHTGVYQPAGSYQGQLSGTGFVKASGTSITYDNTTYQPFISTGTTSQYYRGDKTWVEFPTSMPASDVYAWAKAAVKPTYNKTEVGLGNVDNTSDLDKPLSYEAQGANAALWDAVGARRPKLLGSFTNQVGTVGTATSNLYTLTIPANTLAATGDVVKIELNCSVSSSSTDGSLTISLGSVYLDYAIVWNMKGENATAKITITRTGSNTAKITINTVSLLAGYQAAPVTNFVTRSGFSFGSDQTLYITAAAAAGIIRAESMTVQAWPISDYISL
jgi:hypothetical protein